MTTATLSFHRVQRNLHIRIDSFDFPSINWKSVCFVGLFVSFLLLILYVWQINGLAKSSYMINNYEKQISKLSGANKNLEISFAENSFLGQALDKIKALDFQKTTSVKYIHILDASATVAQASNNL